jgi:chlorobactene glucosyltransferase
MTIIMALWLLGVSLAIAMLLASVRISRFERLGAELSAGLLFATLPFVCVVFTNLPLLIFAVFTHCWLLLLPARLMTGRLERPFLLRSTRDNALLGILLLVLAAVLEVWHPAQLGEVGLTVWLVASVGIAVFFLGQLWWNTRRYHMPITKERLPMSQLPTVSVCIPARNEDHALADCLTSVLASDYPKLEILVLDDCSQDTTSTIIKSFAHDGVRFIQGDAPVAGWLGKNQAMATLAQQASGEYLLFMDVDTHIGPQSISQLAQYMLANKLDMVSVLPQNRLGIHNSTLFGTLEYFWRQVLPLTNKRLPVSSKAWMITAASLQHLGGFASVSRKIVPEESFAVRTAARDSYRFLVGTSGLAITTAKHWSSQIETSIRVMYPRLRRQPMVMYAMCVVIAGLFIAPFFVVCSGLFMGYSGPVFWLAVTAVMLLWLDYALVLMRMQPKNWLLASTMLPVVLIQELIIFVVSMLQYEFGEVTWKGRNVCYPVLSPVQPRYSEQLEAARHQ